MILHTKLKINASDVTPTTLECTSTTSSCLGWRQGLEYQPHTLGNVNAFHPVAASSIVHAVRSQSPDEETPRPSGCNIANDEIPSPFRKPLIQEPSSCWPPIPNPVVVGEASFDLFFGVRIEQLETLKQTAKRIRTLSKTTATTLSTAR